LNAEIVERQGIGIGITDSEVVTLDDGMVQHDAQIQTIYEQESIKRFENGTTEIGFTDFYTYNIAGYRLDRLIGLDMVPVAVPRRDSRQNAAFMWWIDDVQMMEADRYLEDIPTPRPLE
jgi:hypothetical protein